jgi:hypothetical protein
MAYIADRIEQQGTLPTGLAQCRIYSPYITAGYLPAAPEVITQHLIELLADGEAVFSVPGTPYNLLWRRSMLDIGWNNNNDNNHINHSNNDHSGGDDGIDDGAAAAPAPATAPVAPVEITMVDLSSLLFGLSTLWLDDGFYQKYTNHGWWANP